MKSRHYKLLLATILVVLSGCLAVALAKVGWVDLYLTGRQLPKVRKEAIASGLILDYRVLTQETSCAPSDNAWPGLKPAFQELYSDPALKDAKTVELRLEALKQHKSAIDNALVALEKPRIDFHRDWSKGIMVKFPEYAESKVMAKCLAAKMREASAAGDLESFQQYFIANERLAILMTQEPLDIPFLVGVAIHEIGGWEVYLAMTAHPNDPKWLQFGGDVSKGLLGCEPLQQIKGEPCLLLATLEPVGQGMVESLALNTTDPEFAKHPWPTGPFAKDVCIT